MQIKRTLAFVDDVAIEAGQTVSPPLRKVAAVAVMLAQDTAKGITGQAINVDGGQAMI